jgi:hypothetical protein
MLERMHQLGPLKLAAIIATLLALTGVVVLTLFRDGGSESTPEAARNPVESESAETPPSTTDAGIDDAGAGNGGDPNPTNRGGNAARASESGGQNGQESEPSSTKGPPAKATKPPQGSEDDEASSNQLPRNLPPELERLLGGFAEGD